MPQYCTTIISDTGHTGAVFPDIDQAFKHIIEELIKHEQDFTNAEATKLMDDVKNIYINNGKPVEFNVWEIETNGSVVKMYINEII